MTRNPALLAGLAHADKLQKPDAVQGHCSDVRSLKKWRRGLRRKIQRLTRGATRKRWRIRP